MKTRVLAALFALVVAAPASAQNVPAFEVSGGYSLLRDQASEESFHGWLASVTGNLNRMLGITFEVEGSSKTLEELDGENVDFGYQSFMFGPRLSSRRSENVTPFAHVLIGGSRASVNLLGMSVSSTNLALQPGGGVDIWMASNIGIRAGGDYRRVFAEEAGINQYRFHVGMVIGAGSR